MEDSLLSAQRGQIEKKKGLSSRCLQGMKMPYKLEVGIKKRDELGVIKITK